MVSPDIVPVKFMTCVCVPAGVLGLSWNVFDSVELNVRLSGVPVMVPVNELTSIVSVPLFS